jgi:MGT family glycosyltransferase
MVRRATSALVVMPREFDDWPDKPEHVTHVGPIFEEALPPIGGEPPQASPWREDDRPLIVISLGSTYMHQERLLERIGRSVASPDRRVILLTGHDLAPADLPGVPGEVEIRRFVPHAAILPHAALVITHGGMGSLMAAFAAGVPTICLPLGRDQDANAARAAELGTSIVLAPDADERTIAEAVGRALASAEMRASARQMQAALRGYETAQLAVEAVERAGRARPEPIPR